MPLDIKLIRKNQCLQNYRMSQKENQFLVSASPKVRKFARELGANVVEIPGSLRAGRVSEEDVKNFIRSQVTVSGGKIEKKIYKEEYSHEELVRSICRIYHVLKNYLVHN